MQSWKDKDIVEYSFDLKEKYLCFSEWLCLFNRTVLAKSHKQMLIAEAAITYRCCIEGIYGI